MEKTRFGDTELQASVIALGTWVTGGWAWGGAEDKDSIDAILNALDLGINLIDTAPVYGFGRSEEVIGRALKQWRNRGDVIIATKCGLEWDERHNIRRNSTPERIRHEIDQSLSRLDVETIDLYQIHWPDSATPFEATIEALLEARKAGKIRYIGLSNFSLAQIQACRKTGTVTSLQPPYNIFERQAEDELLPFCANTGIATLVYGGLCRGLLTGKFTGDEKFPKGDLRRSDPKFKPDRFRQYVKAVDQLKKLAGKYNKTMAQFALRWAVQQPGVTTVIAGARTNRQAQDNAGASGWQILDEDLRKVDEIIKKHIKTPIGPEFMAPRGE